MAGDQGKKEGKPEEKACRSDVGEEEEAKHRGTGVEVEGESCPQDGHMGHHTGEMKDDEVGEGDGRSDEEGGIAAVVVPVANMIFHGVGIEIVVVNGFLTVTYNACWEEHDSGIGNPISCCDHSTSYRCNVAGGHIETRYGFDCDCRPSLFSSSGGKTHGTSHSRFHRLECRR